MKKYSSNKELKDMSHFSEVDKDKKYGKLFTNIKMCDNCTSYIFKDSKICNNCKGVPLNSFYDYDMKICIHCNQNVSYKESICFKCKGKPVKKKIDIIKNNFNMMKLEHICERCHESSINKICLSCISK